MPVPVECQPIQDAIAVLEEQRREAWADLQEAIADGDLHGKWAAAARAGSLARQILAKKQALEACVADHGGAVPLAAVFVGTCTFTGDHADVAARGPFEFPIRLGLWFDALRTRVQITDFPGIPVGPFDVVVPFVGTIEVSVLVTMVSAGIGSYSTSDGAISIALTLSFDVDRDFPIIEEDSLLPLTLTTAQGAGVNAIGNVTLAGSGTFVGGRLGGSSGTIVCIGKISPHP